MGPPKKRPPRVGVDMRIKQENHFEYRWDTSLGHYYLFNPYTGETILGEDHNNINRSRADTIIQAQHLEVLMVLLPKYR